ncbi:hypothetical protein D9758_014935 [Tetrapyrgos nigripes]|uniref:F-box domain-containing protein n=1 Tax=Tetrapyrgos nigripes TaxID=182062 RepID=A0A8H5C9G5_9AGAR|nr:hypothetical protein D9758_014935 [Tetrapyrgos nigripes]
MFSLRQRFTGIYLCIYLSDFHQFPSRLLVSQLLSVVVNPFSAHEIVAILLATFTYTRGCRPSSHVGSIWTGPGPRLAWRSILPGLGPSTEIPLSRNNFVFLQPQLRCKHFKLIAFTIVKASLAITISTQKLDILQLLHNNFGASDTSDIRHFSQCLVDAECDAQCCEEEIRRLEANIIQLQNKQQFARRRAEQFSSLLAPIRRLPSDILGRVFSLLCAENSIYLKLDLPAFCLSQVCAKWRKLVLSTPSLWSSLYVDAECSRPDEHVKALVDLYLQRSKHHPLHLRLSMLRETSLASDVLKSISAHSARWRSLSLKIRPILLKEDNFPSVKSNLPSLTRLRIWQLRLQPNAGSFEVFRIAPMLKDIAISANPWISIPLPLGPDIWLTFHSCDVRDAFQYLTMRATEVRDLTFSECTNFPDVPDNVTLHNLHTLTIAVHYKSPNLSFFLDSLILPSLTKLRLSLAKGHEPVFFEYTHDSMTSFLNRSGCSITSLELTNLRILDGDVLSLIRILPSLTSLTMHGNMEGEPLLPLLPRLKQLDLRYYADHSFPRAALLDMVRSRWLPDAQQSSEIGVDCLSAFTLRPIGNVSDSDLRPLQVLRAARLRVVIQGAAPL